jgi:hemerythrin-like domain-containing protein
MFRHEALRPLSRQHHNGLALVVMARRGIEKRGEAAVENWCARAVERFDSELVGHFEAEEAILFPAVREAADAGLVDELVAEHRRMEELIMALRTAPSRRILEEFLDLLKSHIRREENELFELAQAKLSEESLGAMGGVLKERVVESCLMVDSEES